MIPEDEAVELADKCKPRASGDDPGDIEKLGGSWE